MATQTPSIFHKENLHVLRGNSNNPQKKNTKKGAREGRRALADLSNAPLRKDPHPFSSKSGLRNKLSSPAVGLSTKKIRKASALTEEEVGKCREWAKEGIERIHFTGNDVRKAEKEIHDLRVKEEVEMVMSSMKGWAQTDFDSFFQEVARDIQDVERLEIEPVVDLPISKSSPGDEADDPLLGNELHLLPDEDIPIVLNLQDDDAMP